MQLKEDMDKIQGYTEKHLGDYVNMLSYYCDCKYIILSDTEKLELYSKSLAYYETLYEIDNSYDVLERLNNMKFNIHRIKKEYDQMIYILKEVNMISRIEAEAYVQQMLRDIKEIDASLYEKAIASITKCYSI